VIERSGFVGCGRATAEEALQLLAAPNCPSGRFDLLLMPDQMMLADPRVDRPSAGT